MTAGWEWKISGRARQLKSTDSVVPALDMGFGNWHGLRNVPERLLKTDVRTGQVCKSLCEIRTNPRYATLVV
jgi:hypothetical protein